MESYQQDAEAATPLLRHGARHARQEVPSLLLSQDLSRPATTGVGKQALPFYWPGFIMVGDGSGTIAVSIQQGSSEAFGSHPSAEVVRRSKGAACS